MGWANKHFRLLGWLVSFCEIVVVLAGIIWIWTCASAWSRRLDEVAACFRLHHKSFGGKISSLKGVVCKWWVIVTGIDLLNLLLKSTCWRTFNGLLFAWKSVYLVDFTRLCGRTVRDPMRTTLNKLVLTIQIGKRHYSGWLNLNLLELRRLLRNDSRLKLPQLHVVWQRLLEKVPLMLRG